MSGIKEYVAKRNAEAAASGSTTRLLVGTREEIAAQRAAAQRHSPQANKSLPKGIGAGKMTAIVAGVAIAGGALYALSHRQEKQAGLVGPWTTRVEEERVTQTNALQR